MNDVTTMRYLAVFILLVTSTYTIAQNFPNAEAVGVDIGQQAPSFEGIDQNGERFSLATALEQGPVLISFFRGEWCRYCVAQLKDIQDSLALLSEHDIRVVTVTPAQDKGVQKATQLTKAEFPIISDKGLNIMHAYKVITEANFQKYEEELEAGTDNQSKNLPVPAAYLVDQSGKVIFRYFDPNYRTRPTVRSVLEAVEK